MFGEHASRVITIRGMTVHTNLEAVAIMAATGLAGTTPLHGVLVVASFAFGTALHLACHLLVAVAFGKGIDRMVLTRAGRIDYSGGPPGFVEGLLRTAAGASMNGLCAIGGTVVLATIDLAAWPPTAVLALRTFTGCSLILTIINFLPAIPLDGGLILRSILARWHGEDRATRIAAHVSVGLMVVMGIVGIVMLQPVLVYLAIVISYDNRHKLRAPAVAHELAS